MTKNELLHIDALLLTETWLHKDIDNDVITIPGFDIMRSDRKHDKKKRGGGVAIYLKCASLNPTKEIMISNELFDLILVKCNYNNKYSVVLGCVYINHTYQKLSALEMISDEIENFTSSTDSVFLGGDFNKAPTKQVFECLGLVNVVGFPTRGDSFLDQIWTSVGSGLLNVKETVLMSDHAGIECVPKYHKFSKPRAWIKQTSRKLNKEKMTLELDCTDWDALLHGTDNIDDANDVITDYIKFVERTCTDYTIFYIDELNGQATNQSIKYARRQKEKAYKANSTVEFNYWNKILNNEIKKLEMTMLNDLFKRKDKSYFNKLKALAGRQTKDKQNFNFNPDELNEHFLRFERDEDLVVPDKYEGTDSGHDTVVTDDLIIDLIDRLPNTTSTDPDDLKANIIKSFKKQLTKPIGYLLNQCVKDRKLPKSWKKIKITPVPKIKKPVACSDMRPVGQTPVFLKLLEYLIKGQLRDLCDAQDTNQFAYRGGTGTDVALMTLVGETLKGLDEGAVHRGISL